MIKTLSKQEVEYLLLNYKTPEKIKDWVQWSVYNAWKMAGFKGSFEGATGVGKTRIAVLAADEEFRVNPDAVVYIGVPTETLRDVDWPDEFRKWDCGHLIEKINFVCHASMDKIKEPRDIDLFIFDEIHNATPINTTIFTRNKVFRVLGLSATLPDMDGYDNDRNKRILIDSLAPSFYKIPLETAVSLKLVSDFEIYLMKFDLDDKDYYVDGGTKAKPHKTTEVKQYRYLTKMLQRATYSKPEAKFTWIQKRMAFLYSLRQKEILAQEVMDNVLENKRTLIFCGGIEQANKLCKDWVYHSKTDSKHLTLFQEQKIPYLGVVQALNEGKNIEQLDQILVIQINSKELDIIQRIGRTIRFREGHLARVIILVAKGTVDEKWANSALENFDKKRIKEYYVKPTAKAA